MNILRKELSEEQVLTRLKILGAKTPDFFNRRLVKPTRKIELSNRDIRPIQAMVMGDVHYFEATGLPRLLSHLAAMKKISVKALFQEMGLKNHQKDTQKLLRQLVPSRNRKYPVIEEFLLDDGLRTRLLDLLIALGLDPHEPKCNNGDVYFETFFGATFRVERLFCIDIESFPESIELRQKLLQKLIDESRRRKWGAKK
ncbi:MAG: hypothetical protein NTX82_04840 [Candidatus Parcubacteria bacterium]|nr:hypothetical protein [Candidatus Parcubacteria bacterium]